jgi:hypothetical protein
MGERAEPTNTIHRLAIWSDHYFIVIDWESCPLHHHSRSNKNLCFSVDIVDSIAEASLKITAG